MVYLLISEVEGFAVWEFFFSSRRRHTRLQGDWSSDVCSSDLGVVDVEGKDAEIVAARRSEQMLSGAMHVHVRVYFRDAAEVVQPVVAFRGRTALRPREARQQAGRKSCRQCESPGHPHTSCTSTPRRRSSSTAASGAARSVIRRCSCSTLAMSEMLRRLSLEESATTTTWREMRIILALSSASARCGVMTPISGSRPSAPRYKRSACRFASAASAM